MATVFSNAFLTAGLASDAPIMAFTSVNASVPIDSAHLESEVSKAWVVGSGTKGTEVVLWDVRLKSIENSTLLLGTSSEFIFVAVLTGSVQLPDQQMVTPGHMAAWLPDGTSRFNVSAFSAEALDASFKAAERDDLRDLLASALKKQKTLLFWGLLRPTTINVACPLKTEVETLRKSYLNQPQVIAARRKSKTVSELAQEVAKVMEIDVAKVREIMKVSQEPTSLETPVGDEEDSHLGDFISDPGPTPYEQTSRQLLKEHMEEVLTTLSDREKKVLILRFGLEDGRPRTLEEVGAQFGVTRERIRQIEAKALRKLRHPSRSKKLKDYLE